MEVLKSTPFGNDFLAELAMRAIDGEELGKDNITDFLAVSFSSTDYVGHTFGPRSMEVQDTYLRLDLTIAYFLEYLDKTVGKDNYLVFLTADHAVAENPAYLNDPKYDVTNVPSKETYNDFNTNWENNKDKINKYAEFKKTDEYKNSAMAQLMDLFRKFGETSGYYEVFIPTMRKLSPAYDLYYKKMLGANEKLIQKIPDI